MEPRATVHFCLFTVIGAALVLWQTGIVCAQGLPESLAGTYTGTATSANGEVAVTCELKIAGGKLTGTLDSGEGPIAITAGTLIDDRLVLTLDMGGMTGTITGTVTKGGLAGQWTLGGMSGACTLTKVPAGVASGA
jgi:hypothetical protein